MGYCHYLMGFSVIFLWIGVVVTSAALMTVDQANNMMIRAGRAIFLTWFASTLVGMITLKVCLDKVEVGRVGERRGEREDNGIVVGERECGENENVSVND
jgi:hypothetical protein